MLTAFAERERDEIKSRKSEGIAVARKMGGQVWSSCCSDP
ncbi:hypothetical protein [Cytobacillus kochii]